MKRLLFGAFLFLTPSLVFAAGFAKQSIFLSSTAPMEGQSLLIHASVSNPTTNTFNGTLVVKDEASEIGRVAVKLTAGAADSVSVPWKPTAGSHTIIADLEDAGGAVIEEGKETFTIAAAPSLVPPPKTLSTQSNTFAAPVDVQPSTPIQESIENVAPVVAPYSSPVLKVIDSGRTAAAAQLHTALDWSKSQAAPSTPSGKTKTEEKSSWAQTAWKIFATAALYVLTILLYIVSNVGIFYPVLAIVFLYVLWKLWRRYRR